MKKLFIWIMIFILTLNLIGCQQNSSDFKFGYTLKEEYTSKVNEELSQTFIDFTKDTVNLYQTAFEDFETYDPMKALDIGTLEMYMYDTIRDYESLDIWNIYEEEILQIMEYQRKDIANLTTLAMTRTNDHLAVQDEREPEHTKEYYDQEIETLKASMKETIELAEKYLD